MTRAIWRAVVLAAIGVALTLQGCGDSGRADLNEDTEATTTTTEAASTTNATTTTKATTGADATTTPTEATTTTEATTIEATTTTEATKTKAATTTKAATGAEATTTEIAPFPFVVNLTADYGACGYWEWLAGFRKACQTVVHAHIRNPSPQDMVAKNLQIRVCTQTLDAPVLYRFEREFDVDRYAVMGLMDAIWDFELERDPKISPEDSSSWDPQDLGDFADFLADASVTLGLHVKLTLASADGPDQVVAYKILGLHSELRGAFLALSNTLSATTLPTVVAVEQNVIF